jgi:hypothetical protein
MHDARPILAGLAVFVGLVTAPAWWRAATGRSGAAPELQLPKDSKQCVEATAFMRARHMELLNEWRDAVVRDGQHVYLASDGKRHGMSLTGTCLRCHAEPDRFCNKCHDYAGVQPTCWACHQQPPQPKRI